MILHQADQIYQHPILNIAGEIVRGGWYFEGESSLFYYCYIDHSL